MDNTIAAFLLVSGTTIMILLAAFLILLGVFTAFCAFEWLPYHRGSRLMKANPNDSMDEMSISISDEHDIHIVDDNLHSNIILYDVPDIKINTLKTKCKSWTKNGTVEDSGYCTDGPVTISVHGWNLTTTSRFIICNEFLSSILKKNTKRPDSDSISKIWSLVNNTRLPYVLILYTYTDAPVVAITCEEISWESEPTLYGLYHFKINRGDVWLYNIQFTIIDTRITRKGVRISGCPM